MEPVDGLLGHARVHIWQAHAGVEARIPCICASWPIHAARMRCMPLRSKAQREVSPACSFHVSTVNRTMHAVHPDIAALLNHTVAISGGIIVIRVLACKPAWHQWLRRLRQHMPGAQRRPPRPHGLSTALRQPCRQHCHPPQCAGRARTASSGRHGSGSRGWCAASSGRKQSRRARGSPSTYKHW